MPRLPLLAGNWKMNLNHLEALALVQKLAFSLSREDLAAAEAVVLPPFTALRSVQTLVDGDKLALRYGAQDVSPHGDGAFTGDVSAGMLAKLGCSYVVVGHSERRRVHSETDDLVAAKVAAAAGAELVPIVCVGEGQDVRHAGGQVEHCVGQLQAALAGLPGEGARPLVVAYEPIWAIGTGETARPGDAQEVCAALRTALAERFSAAVAEDTRVLYGGSMTPDTAADLLAAPDVDGGLIGGASLKPDDFASIIRIAAGRAA